MSFILFIYIVAALFSLFVAGALIGALFSHTVREKLRKVFRTQRLERLLLKKSLQNPILQPGTSPWTAEAVFNPAAVILGGRTHLIYRAIGMDGVSRLGYASSQDGVLFDTRLPHPIYVAQKPSNVPGHLRRYAPVLYPSGGSWGGCEDPRMVALDGRVYVTFNMFDGWDNIRVAAISIAEQDFLAGRFWKWDGPHILSKPGERHKNWVIFPEKIGGKFAILHSVAPQVEIAYHDSIDDIGSTEPFIESWSGPRVNLPIREGVWDSYIRGVGAPPIWTPRGWLLFYHAIDAHDPGRYKLGAMLLDLNDPTIVLHRSSGPVLAPDEDYENHGKPGIVYACGAVIEGDTLFVYYGGADKVVCVATTPLNQFIDDIIGDGQPEIEAARPTQAI